MRAVRRHGAAGEEAAQEILFLIRPRRRVELAGHEEILRSPEELVLGLGDLDDQDRLRLREPAPLPDDPLHLPRFRLADLQVGVGHPAEDKGEGGDVAGPRGIQSLQGARDSADRFRLLRSRVAGTLRRFQPEQPKDRHQNLNRTPAWVETNFRCGSWP